MRAGDDGVGLVALPVAQRHQEQPQLHRAAGEEQGGRVGAADLGHHPLEDVAEVPLLGEVLRGLEGLRLVGRALGELGEGGPQGGEVVVVLPGVLDHQGLGRLDPRPVGGEGGRLVAVAGSDPGQARVVARIGDAVDDVVGGHRAGDDRDVLVRREVVHRGLAVGDADVDAGDGPQVLLAVGRRLGQLVRHATPLPVLPAGVGEDQADRRLLAALPVGPVLGEVGALDLLDHLAPLGLLVGDQRDHQRQGDRVLPGHAVVLLLDARGHRPQVVVEDVRAVGDADALVPDLLHARGAAGIRQEAVAEVPGGAEDGDRQQDHQRAVQGPLGQFQFHGRASPKVGRVERGGQDRTRARFRVRFRARVRSAGRVPGASGAAVRARSRAPGRTPPGRPPRCTGPG